MSVDYLGIDPGLTGGLVVVSGDRIRYKIAMPTITLHNTKDDTTKTEIDRAALNSFLGIFPPHVRVTIEKQEAFRNQSIGSSCTTCKNYGIVLMGLTFARFYITEVPPGDWQAYFGIVSVKKGGGETTKQQAYRIAQAKYPDVDFRKSERARVPHEGVVDATLIARYCQSLFERACDRGPLRFVREEAPLEVESHAPREHATPVEVRKLVVRPGGTVSGVSLKKRWLD